MGRDISWKSHLVDIPRRNVLRANAALGRYDDMVWILGDGRSGTTWLSELLNFDRRYRDMFEPFHPSRVSGMEFLRPHLYVRPGDTNRELYKKVEAVLTGTFTHPKTDFANLRPIYHGLVVKDCFANLFAKWAVDQFPNTKPVLIVRNPFAVALSKQKKPDWYWATDPSNLVEQPDLYDDHLEPLAGVIEETIDRGDDLECQLVNWAIINLVPLKQFATKDLHVCFYEQLFLNPDTVMSELFAYLDHDVRPTGIAVPNSAIEQPSRMTEGSSTLDGDRSPISQWRHELTDEQVERGFHLLDQFGFGSLYDESGVPDPAALGPFRSS